MDEELTAFVRGRYRQLLRRAYLLTGDQSTAEDLVQEALARCCAAWRQHPAHDPDAYVHKVMVNVLISRSRLRRLGEHLAADVPDAGIGDSSAALADRDLLWRAMRQVPPRQRAVLVLRFYDDLGEQEIATLLDISVGTVRSQSAKGLARLRRLDITAERIEERP